MPFIHRFFREPWNIVEIIVIITSWLHLAMIFMRIPLARTMRSELSNGYLIIQ